MFETERKKNNSPGKFYYTWYHKRKKIIFTHEKKTKNISLFFSFFSIFFPFFSFLLVFTDRTWKNYLCKNPFHQFLSYKHRRGNNFDQTWIDHSVVKKKKILATLTPVLFLCLLPLDKHIRLAHKRTRWMYPCSTHLWIVFYCEPRHLAYDVTESHTTGLVI